MDELQSRRNQEVLAGVFNKLNSRHTTVKLVGMDDNQLTVRFPGWGKSFIIDPSLSVMELNYQGWLSAVTVSSAWLQGILRGYKRLNSGELVKPGDPRLVEERAVVANGK